MTLPAPWRRSTARQRRQQRTDFKALRQRCLEAPSAAVLAYRAKNRGDAVRHNARAKVKGALAGEHIQPFSQAQAARIRPAEHEQLREEVHNRLGALTAEERKALTLNQHLLLVCFSVDQLRAVASAAS